MVFCLNRVELPGQSEFILTVMGEVAQGLVDRAQVVDTLDPVGLGLGPGQGGQQQGSQYSDHPRHGGSR